MENKIDSKYVIEIIIRLVLLFAVLFYCFEIILPFIMPALWGIILAVSLNPIQEFFETRFKMKPTLAAIIITLLMLSIVLVPSIIFFGSAIDIILDWKSHFELGSFVMPEVPKFIENLPVIGIKIHEFFSHLNENLEALIIKNQSKIIEIFKSIIGIVVGTGASLLQFVFCIILSGVFLAIGDRDKFSGEVFNRIIGQDGSNYIELIVQTIRSVVKGVLGVAIIQAILAGIGLFLAGIPFAPIWTLLCLILAIVQIGPGPILIGSIIYLFNVESTLFASLWTIYFIGVAISDNILKPILLGRGAHVPMLVIFLGVIGGFLLSGFIGLFTGAIVLSIGYKLFLFWLKSDTQDLHTILAEGKVEDKVEDKTENIAPKPD
jgi:predicted PurR-regulated permease PerM